MTTLSIEEIKAIVFQLPLEELVILLAEIEEKVESSSMMQLAETGFNEWNDPEEDIYELET